MIKGAIFDMDGVIVDNISHHLRAWKQLGRELGRDFKDADVKRVFGKRNREILMSLMGNELSDDELAACGKRKEELYRAIMAPELRPVKGLPGFLAALRNSGVKTAIATSGPIDNVRFVLDGLDLQDAFDSIITGSEVRESKPHPAIFLLAAERLQLSPEDCVVFEDSPPGIQAAKAAGTACVGLATTHSPGELVQYKPDRIIRDFTDITVEDLIFGDRDSPAQESP
ncbi:MAG TPA: HAD family phosphatase [Acidobacteriota bacterium]|nr:HAD family phosphatase [Acidobacteriota bacterium]